MSLQPPGGAHTGRGRAVRVAVRGGQLGQALLDRHDIAAAAGLTDPVTPHVLRHTFGTDFVNSGVYVVTVAEILGHASLDSTRIHTLPADDDLDAAINRLTVDR